MRAMLVIVVGLVVAAFAVEAHPETLAPQAAAYETENAASAAACAQICADDSICMAWSYSAPTCSLRASVGQLQQSADVGLSPRAPGFAKRFVSTPPAPAQIASAETSPAPSPAASHTTSATPGHDADLLGGPVETDLRPRLGQ